MQKLVNKMRSDSACSISVSYKSADSIKDSKYEASIKYSESTVCIKDSNPSAVSYDNNLQYPYNDENILYCVNPRVHVDRALYLITSFKPESIVKLVEMEKEHNIYRAIFFRIKVRYLS